MNDGLLFPLSLGVLVEVIGIAIALH